MLLSVLLERRHDTMLTCTKLPMKQVHIYLSIKAVGGDDDGVSRVIKVLWF